MALLSQEQPVDTNTFLKGTVAKLPKNEQETPSFLFSLFWAVWKLPANNLRRCHQSDGHQTLYRYWAVHPQTSQQKDLPLSPCRIPTEPSKWHFPAQEDRTWICCLPSFLCSLPLNASSTRPTEQTTRSIAPICPCTSLSTSPVATWLHWRKSIDKDRITLTVHIHNFENTLQQWTHIRPTKCTWK